jgi:hypothetical protein
MKKNRIMLLLALLAAVAGILLPIVFMQIRDIPPPDVSDLTVERPAVAPEENAYTYFAEATNVFYWPPNFSLITNYLAGNAVAGETLTDIIAKNQKMVKLIERGIACPICLMPALTIFDENQVVPYGTWWQMGWIMALQSRYERLAGRHADATATCIALLKFGDMLQANAEFRGIFSSGLMIREKGLAQAQDLARDPTTPLEELDRLANCLASLAPTSAGIGRVIKLEYWSGMNYRLAWTLAETDRVDQVTFCDCPNFIKKKSNYSGSLPPREAP